MTDHAGGPVPLPFTQVAWVIPDIRVAERFFCNTMGIKGFVKLENVRAEDTAGTYRGAPGDYVFHLYMAYSGGALLELIQPVSGTSVFSEFLQRCPTGGVQHVAFMVNESEYVATISRLAHRGLAVTQTLELPVAKVTFFDSESEIGVATEIIGITEAGYGFVEEVKRVSQ